MRAGLVPGFSDESRTLATVLRMLSILVEVPLDLLRRVAIRILSNASPFPNGITAGNFWRPSGAFAHVSTELWMAPNDTQWGHGPQFPGFLPIGDHPEYSLWFPPNRGMARRWGHDQGRLRAIGQPEDVVVCKE